jgi:hypothetical protein
VRSAACWWPASSAQSCGCGELAVILGAELIEIKAGIVDWAYLFMFNVEVEHNGGL